MDYTTLNRVKQEMHVQNMSGSGLDDSLVSTLITAASRAIDRKCTGVPDASNYFVLESIVNERLQGQMDSTGMILLYPHKPIIQSVTAFSYQQDITQPITTVTMDRVEADGPRVMVYPQNNPLQYPGKVRANISYTGGLATSGSTLPDDLQEIAAILVVRFYREAETNLSDSIGVADMASLIYTHAWPVRCERQIETFVRKVGWRFVA
jgi:hypothetical protein